jgi:hypothetical protein
MSLKRAIIAALCGSILVSSTAFGQEQLISKVDTRIEASAPFVKNTHPDVAPQSASGNEGILCTYRLFPNHLKNTQTYSPYKRSIGLRDNSDHVCAANIFRFSVKRWSPITPAAALIFDSRTVRDSVLDFSLDRPSLPRAEQRGSFYNSATLNKGGLNDLYRFSNGEVPAAVFGYNF